MPAPDAKTRSKIALSPTKIWSTSRVPVRLLPRIILSNVLFVLSLCVGKEWLLALDVGVFWIVMRVLACGGVGVLVWEALTGQLSKRSNIEWSTIGAASVLSFLQTSALFIALYRLPSLRVILFASFPTLWIEQLLNSPFTLKSWYIALAMIISLLSDCQFSLENAPRFAPGYLALIGHGITSFALDHTLKTLAPSVGTTFAIASSTLGAAIFALPFYVFRLAMFPPASSAVLPLISLALLPFISYTLLFMTPITNEAVSRVSPFSPHFSISFPLVVTLSCVLGPLAFSHYPSLSDIISGSFLFLGMLPEATEVITSTPRTPTSRLVRSYFKTILSNAESRRIFYFLMLNLCYMLVQMLYGVWTNSLGLISDAIHMAFDCMAIGVGLLASVMATWEPNEQFTYGYGRIETLSGFANGIFLLLISIFIVFEAIERIIDPPEMNTSQLLLVSTVGLAVNLFGMFAMGGHHHGGHGHSHGHSHSHSHTQAPLSSPSALPPVVTHSHSHSHNGSPVSPEGEGSDHLNSHSHSHSPSNIHSDSHHEDQANHHDDCGHSHSHDHSHSHSHTHTHTLPLVTFPTQDEDDDTHNTQPTPAKAKKHKRPFTGADIKTHRHTVSGVHLSPLLSNGDIASPITPHYHFGHDEHFLLHHESEHAPNLHDHKHSHSHAHEGHSHNMRGVFLHVMADTLGSVGVIISTLLIQFYGWTGFDPIASLFIAILIAGSVYPLVLDTGKILSLDVGDRADAIHHALQELTALEGISGYSQARFWPKDADTLIGAIHVHVSPNFASLDPGGPHSMSRTTYSRLDPIVERVDSLLRQKIPGLEELTIQVNPGS